MKLSIKTLQGKTFQIDVEASDSAFGFIVLPPKRMGAPLLSATEQGEIPSSDLAASKRSSSVMLPDVLCCDCAGIAKVALAMSNGKASVDGGIVRVEVMQVELEKDSQVLQNKRSCGWLVRMMNIARMEILPTK